MAYTARVFNVMIASPSDVAAERALIREVLADWNVVNAERRRAVVLPVGWETHSTPAMGEKPQQILNKQVLERCDLLVGVFWTRLGTPTDDYASGTVEEIERHIAAGRPAMLYFSTAPVLPDSVDSDQYNRLKEFRASCQQRGLYEVYADVSEFRLKFLRQIQIKLNDDSYFQSDEAPAESLPVAGRRVLNLSVEATELLKEGSRDSNGMIMRLPSDGGTRILSNQRAFVEPYSPRSFAIWNAALLELENAELIEADDTNRFFRLTRLGFETVERLP